MVGDQVLGLISALSDNDINNKLTEHAPTGTTYFFLNLLPSTYLR